MDLKTTRVLVVEDEIHLRRLIATVLESSGFSVEAASNGEEAWARLTRTPRIDLVITDLNMPNTDGFELLRRMRELSQAAPPPVIVLTAVGQLMQHARAIELGAGRVMTKPFSSLEILDAVKERLASSGAL